jgi:hypothetical protein
MAYSARGAQAAVAAAAEAAEAEKPGRPLVAIRDRHQNHSEDLSVGQTIKRQARQGNLPVGASSSGITHYLAS